MKRTILFVGGGTEAVPGIVRAKQLGLHVVASDADGQAPGLIAADDRLVVSTYDIAATVQSASDYHRRVRPLDGVLCVATDVPLTVAAVAKRLGLPGIPLASAQLAMDKVAMKDRFAADGVPVPRYRAVSSSQELESAVREIGYPIVVKPVDSRGARGVLRLTGATDLNWAYQTARAQSPTQRVMVERFLPGPQISTESLVLDGVAFTPGFSDRNYEYLERFAPHIIENGGDLPSILPLDVQNRVRTEVQRAAASLGIRNGVIKGDIVVSENEVFVIEVAARLSGGYFCTHEIPLNTGVDFVAAAIRLALGDTIEPTLLMGKFQQPVCQRYWFPNPGIVTGIAGIEAARGLPGVKLLELSVRPGQRIGPVNAHPARAGVVICTGSSREHALARAQAAINTVQIEVGDATT